MFLRHGIFDFAESDLSSGGDDSSSVTDTSGEGHSTSGTGSTPTSSPKEAKNDDGDNDAKLMEEKRYYDTLQIPNEDIGNGGIVTDKEDSLPPVPMQPRNEYNLDTKRNSLAKIDEISPKKHKKKKKKKEKKKLKKKTQPQKDNLDNTNPLVQSNIQPMEENDDGTTTSSESHRHSDKDTSHKARGDKDNDTSDESDSSSHTSSGTSSGDNSEKVSPRGQYKWLKKGGKGEQEEFLKDLDKILDGNVDEFVSKYHTKTTGMEESDRAFSQMLAYEDQ